MISQEFINRMEGGTSTFANGNGKINRRLQDQRLGGGRHWRQVTGRPGVSTHVTSINLQWSRGSSRRYV